MCVMNTINLLLESGLVFCTTGILYKHPIIYFTDTQGIRRRFVLKVEGLARVSKHAEKTTTSSDRGVTGRYMG